MSLALLREQAGHDPPPQALHWSQSTPPESSRIGAASAYAWPEQRPSGRTVRLRWCCAQDQSATSDNGPKLRDTAYPCCRSSRKGSAFRRPLPSSACPWTCPGIRDPKKASVHGPKRLVFQFSSASLNGIIP